MPGIDDWLIRGGKTFAGSVARAINEDYLGEERVCVERALSIARQDAAAALEVTRIALQLVERVRSGSKGASGLDAFLREYDLGSKEGVVLMCLAEALLRIPDALTADRLIADKISTGDWSGRLGDSRSLFVNASTWGLMLTGRLMQPEPGLDEDPAPLLARLVARIGEPVVRTALRQAMRILGAQFVMGRTIGEAIERARRGEHARFRHSFDMLGESALTAAAADHYFAAYSAAIDAVAAAYGGVPAPRAASISVKLSALHPRYELAQRERIHKELVPRVLALAERAARSRVSLTIDAEESERLESSLEVIEAVARAPALRGWNGFGLAVQAYQRRALAVIDWLTALAATSQCVLNVRLVKGAYWDSEIKRAQERGLRSFPVFTRKVSTDVCYLACARRLFDSSAQFIYPQFATHNAHTVAYILQLKSTAPQRAFEFQRLHGMGEELYAQVIGGEPDAIACRVYAPVGSHEELLPYLVRRLLENGANTSFVNRIVDEALPIEEVVRDPIVEVERLGSIPNPSIATPSALFGACRVNSAGLNLSDSLTLDEFARESAPFAIKRWAAVRKRNAAGARRCLNPANIDDVVGEAGEATPEEIEAALQSSAAAQEDWNAIGAPQRAQALRAAADAFELHRAELVALCMREAGKTLGDALSEVREAVDFLRYYSHEAERLMGSRRCLPGPTGERNELELHGRGTFACISPWNFPLAIFTGQVSAALAAGNTVVAKPAEQTPLIATRAVELLHSAGVPRQALTLLCGDGARIGKKLLDDVRIGGVAFTGSTQTAQLINRQLAARPGAIAALIAETGGQNAMLADSSALPEQVVADAIGSAFNSAGQRCSALRVLMLQEEVADAVIDRLRGAMDELVVGNPTLLATDVGPVIDADALAMLAAHLQRMRPHSRWVHRAPLDPALERQGFFFAPTALEIDSLSILTQEVFGPVMHVLRYRARDLDATIDAINDLGFGLTLGVHTRIETTARRVAARARVGNVYVNRNMVGAVVGVQPFGGCRLSGTGPKAGGPHYLFRFASERTITVNTAAIGGNASLLSMAAEVS